MVSLLFPLILDEMVGVAGWVAVRGGKDCFFAANQSCLCRDTPADPPKKHSTNFIPQNKKLLVFDCMHTKQNKWAFITIMAYR